MLITSHAKAFHLLDKGYILEYTYRIFPLTILVFIIFSMATAKSALVAAGSGFNVNED